jgi:outer membrane protein assembly factor BamB
VNKEPIESTKDASFKPLRIWPVVLLLIGMVVTKLLPILTRNDSEEFMLISVFFPMLLGALIVIWWVTFSRAKWFEKFLGFFGFLIAIAIAWFASDKTMLGPAFVVLGPLGAAGFGIAALLFSRTLSAKRTYIAIAAAILGFGVLTLFRSDGMWGDGRMGLSWRWEKSAEEILVANLESEPSVEEAPKYSDEQLQQWLQNPEWAQFRGPRNAGLQTGVTFSADWSTEPKLLWKVPVGPGWSSFAVAGNLLFTQEQLGDNETVSCFAADNGEIIWKQQITERFFDPLGGPGPRATPTLANGMLFAQSATGLVQRLDPKSGKLIWSQDIKKIAMREPPYWGFSSSPLVVGGNVIVYAGGEDGKGVLAFDVENGEIRWTAKAGTHSYSSPQLTTLHDRDCVLMLTDFGLNIIDPKNGEQLLDYQWQHGEYRATQPQLVDGDSILMPTQTLGTRRIRVLQNESEAPFVAEEEWTSLQLKSDFNDFVIFENNAYGFDGRIFVSIDLATGKRNWKGGRYGKGQVLLLRDSALLLVMSENGEVVLLQATPDSHQEAAKFQALNERTWNHPVVIGDRLFVRNSEEAACYVLPTKSP